MEAWKKVFVYVACSGLFAAGLILPAVAQQAAGPPQQDSVAAQPLLVANGERAGISELPDSPGATVAKSEDAAKQQNASGQPWSAATPSSQNPQSSSSGTQTQPPPQKPVGTAVAEAPHAGGVAASQPAGVAIAPAKQRRVRTIVLRMGAIVGAGVAVGSVVALTAATGSKPPGAH
jgi:hypothetical protein